MLPCELMDKEVKLQRVAVGQTLKRAHEEMDRNVKLQRVKMDMANMQARAYLDKNLREARREMDYKLKLQELRMETKNMQERAKTVSKVHDIIYFYCDTQHTSHNEIAIVTGTVSLAGRPFEGTISPAFEGTISPVLCSHGNHIKPGCTPPEGMSLLLSQEDLDQIVRAHSDTKKCDLYLVTNRHFPGDGYDESDEDHSEPEDDAWNPGFMVMDV